MSETNLIVPEINSRVDHRLVVCSEQFSYTFARACWSAKEAVSETTMKILETGRHLDPLRRANIVLSLNV